MRICNPSVSALLLTTLLLLAPTAAQDDSPGETSGDQFQVERPNFENRLTMSLADMFPSQTCWGETFDIIVSGHTGDLREACHDDPEIVLRFMIMEKDLGGIFPDDKVYEQWKTFPTNGLTVGIPYDDTLRGIHLADWCDETDWTGEFWVEVYGPCPTATYDFPLEEVALIFYPVAPTLVAPGDGASVTDPIVTLQWKSRYNVDYYQVQLDDDQTFDSPLLDEQTGSLQFEVVNLDSGTTYSWRVRAHNNSCGDGNWSGASEFTYGIATTVSDDEAPFLPLAFELSQNSPNPFNPTTQIGFALPRACQVTLDIYNIAGQRVKRLVDERMTSGHKIVMWDGTNDSGAAVASGVYVYRLAAGAEQASRRMVLLR